MNYLPLLARWISLGQHSLSASSGGLSTLRDSVRSYKYIHTPSIKTDRLNENLASS